MKDGSNRSGFPDEDEGLRSGETDPFAAVIFDFEDTGESLSLLPLAARRALDVAGFRLSLEGWQSLGLNERKDLSVEGGRDAVDPSSVEHAVRRSAIPATRIRPVPDPDALLPPEQLSTFLGPRRAIDPAQWARLRALDRYALVHVLRRSIAHDDPIRLEAAIGTILPRGASVRPSPADRRSSGRPGRRISPGPSSPGRLPKQKETQQTPRPPSTSQRPSNASPDRRSSPVTSRSEREAFSSSPPERSLARTTNRAQRDTLESVDQDTALSARGSQAPLGGQSRMLRPLEHFEDIERDEAFDSSPFADSVPPRDHYSSHLSDNGEARMVDVGDKPVTHRRATAQGVIRMRRETARRVVDSDVPKGDVLSTARIAGIMAAKRTPDLVPLCHHVALTNVEVQIDIDATAGLVTVVSTVEAHDRTGVEMEALTAVTVACLAIYDMLKGIDRDMSVSDIKLLEKSGGRTGNYVRRGD